MDIDKSGWYANMNKSNKKMLSGSITNNHNIILMSKLRELFRRRTALISSQEFFARTGMDSEFGNVFSEKLSEFSRAIIRNETRINTEIQQMTKSDKSIGGPKVGSIPKGAVRYIDGQANTSPGCLQDWD